MAEVAELIKFIASPMSLLLVVLIFGVMPGLTLRLLVLIYPKNHPRRRELIAELYQLGRMERLFFVGEQLETALCDGLGQRLADFRGRRRAVSIDQQIGIWASMGGGDAILQYELYPNGTYQHVGIVRQRVANGTFEFEIYHEGTVKITASSMTFDAFRAAASRRHPDSPEEDYIDAPRRVESSTLTWRLQRRGAQKLLVLTDSAGPPVIYQRIDKPPCRRWRRRRRHAGRHGARGR